MQRYNAMVNLHGERHQVLHKHGLSAAEIQVLQAIHGPQSVHNIMTEGGVDKTPHRQEYDRLARAYRRSRVGEDSKQVVPMLFNATNPKLPVTVKDLGLADNLLHESLQPKKAKGKTADTNKGAGGPPDDGAGGDANDDNLME